MNVTYCRFARVRGIKVPPGRFEGRGRHSNNDVTIATPEKSRFHLLTHPSPAQWAESRRERALGGAGTPPARHPVFQTATVCPRARVPGRRTACIHVAHQLNLASAPSQKTGTPRGGYTTVSGERAPSPGAPVGKTQAEVKESQEYAELAVSARPESPQRPVTDTKRHKK